MDFILSSPEVQDFIFMNADADTERLVLQGSPIAGVTASVLAIQIDSRRRAESKIPFWHNTRGIIYPSKLSMEQCSSELTARYKVTLLRGQTVADLTGGFGVDSTTFSIAGFKVSHFELNPELSAIVNHNAQLLKAPMKTIIGNSIERLTDDERTYDTIYLDPSRRLNTRKVFLLADCEPNLIENLSLLKERADRIIIKTSPLLDIASVIRELQFVSEVHILSVRNDCKEVLYVIDPDSKETDPLVVCALLNDKEQQSMRYRLSEESQANEAGQSEPLNYLYEPDVALLKAGCFKLIAPRYGVLKLHKHTHLYTSAKRNHEFPGRQFEIETVRDYKDFLRNSDVKKANIICRNFPVKADEVRRRLRIADGGDVYLIFCTGPRNERLVITCTRLK